jgi:hypothetical protein
MAQSHEFGRIIQMFSLWKMAVDVSQPSGQGVSESRNKEKKGGGRARRREGGGRTREMEWGRKEEQETIRISGEEGERKKGERGHTIGRA